MKVYIIIVLYLTAAVTVGQESTWQEPVSGRSEHEEGYGPEPVIAPLSATVTIPTTATAAANAYSANFRQPSPVGGTLAPIPKPPTAVQPPMMLMPYSFQYGVDDDQSGLDFGHKESSDGAVVTGTYYVLLPDGRMQTVNYKADANGYVADVSYDGTAKYDNAQSQNIVGSSSGTSAQLKAPNNLVPAVPASPPAPPTRPPSQPLPIPTTATTVSAIASPVPVWPAVKAPVVPLTPTVAPTPSIIPATSAPVAPPALATAPAVAVPIAIWTQTAVSSSSQLPQVPTAQSTTSSPAAFVRSSDAQPTGQNQGVQSLSYGQPSPSIPAPVPAYPIDPIPLTPRTTPKPVVNPYSV